MTEFLKGLSEFLKSLRSWADVMGLSSHPLPVSVTFAVIVGVLSGICCYRFLTYVPKADDTKPASSTVNTTFGPASPIMSDNHGDVVITNAPRTSDDEKKKESSSSK